tara:strand:- start:83 stop:862 length:780 start_codon:yes stop_codon:yes gene_type:complete
MDYTSDYAEIYDILRSYIDHKLEIDKLDSFISEIGINKNECNILSVGCGTGFHELLLAKKDFSIVGIDLSENMIERAKNKNNFKNIDFIATSLEEFNSSQKFSFAYSLGNVINCLPKLSDLISFFKHLNKFLIPSSKIYIEFWNSIPCIIDPPKKVTRNYVDENQKFNLERIATPTNNLINQEVIINYQITGENNGKIINAHSTHKLTLFTILELEYALELNGFENISFYSALPSMNKLNKDSLSKERMIGVIANKVKA